MAPCSLPADPAPAGRLRGPQKGSARKSHEQANQIRGGCGHRNRLAGLARRGGSEGEQDLLSHHCGTLYTEGCRGAPSHARGRRSEEHTSELQSLAYLVCRLLLEKKKKQ